MAKKPLESSIEEYFKKQAKKAGFLCWKFITPSQDGVPDRILIGHGMVAFAELKRPGETPRPLQRYVLGLINSHGIIAEAVDSKEAVDKFLSKLTLKHKTSLK